MCNTCNNTGSIPASGTTLATGADDNGHEACPDCSDPTWRPCFAPLEKHLRRYPYHRSLPWEYMGHDGDNMATYRERETGWVIRLSPAGHGGGRKTGSGRWFTFH